MPNRKYMSIPPGAIIPGSLPRFKIYIISQSGRHILWAADGEKVTIEQLNKLAEAGHKEVYIDLEEEVAYEEYLEEHLGDILANQNMPDDQKAAIFSRVSTNVVRDSFEKSFNLGNVSPEIIKRTQSMVKKALIFIAESNSLNALAKMIGHDYKTYEHAIKLLWFTVAFLKNNQDILEEINPCYKELDDVKKRELLEQCGVAALLHDIGKALIPQEVLNKKGPLNEVEWEIIKRHPLGGLAMLLESEVPLFVKKAILEHHEDFNGNGYPMNLKGNQISVLARILRIIDVFDAMTSKRPYKDALPPSKAVQIMVGINSEESKTQDCEELDKRDIGMRYCFDERLLKKFILFLGKIAA